MTTRALVLGGGGPVGIAWETGLIAGLAENGVALHDADHIVGTSAGSFVGAQLALGRTPEELYEAQISAAERFETGERAQSPAPNTTALMRVFQLMVTGEASLPEIRREAGRIALETNTMSEDQFVAMMRALQPLPSAWPERSFACTAINALSGEPVVWSNASGVELDRAVSSSCAVPGIYPPITINGRRYYDGGIGSATNSTLAGGYERVVVVAVSGGATGAMSEEMKRMRDAANARFEAELEELRGTGSEVEVVRPDEAAVEVFGVNLMDARRRRPAAEAGLAQGRSEAGRLAAFWN